MGCNMCTMSGDSRFPWTLFVMFLHLKLYIRGVNACTDESTCSALVLSEPATCNEENMLSKCCMSCGKLLRGKDEEMDGRTLFEDNVIHVSKLVKLHPAMLRAPRNDNSHKATRPSMKTKLTDKVRPTSVRTTINFGKISTSDADIRLESIRTTSYSDISHEKQVAIYNTKLIIGVNVGVIVFVMIIVILGFAIWRKAHRSRRHETSQVIGGSDRVVKHRVETSRDSRPVPPPRTISSKANKKTRRQSPDDIYHIIHDGVDHDIDNPIYRRDQSSKNVLDNKIRDSGYMEFIGEASDSSLRSAYITSRNRSQPDSVMLTTEDDYLRPVKSYLPPAAEHIELETVTGIKPGDAEETIYLTPAKSNDDISNHFYDKDQCDDPNICPKESSNDCVTSVTNNTQSCTHEDLNVIDIS